MSRSAREYLRHMLDEISFVQGAAGGIQKESFLADEVLKRAIVRSLEIIGEAVKQLPTELTSQQPQIPWKAIARTRDRLIHHYFGVDYDIVWDVVENHIGPLQIAATDLLQNLPAEDPSAIS